MIVRLYEYITVIKSLNFKKKKRKFHKTFTFHETELDNIFTRRFDCRSMIVVVEKKQAHAQRTYYTVR